MDKDSQAQFDNIVRKAPHELTESDVAFLKARSFYLTAQHREVFAEALGLDEKPKKKREE